MDLSVNLGLSMLETPTQNTKDPGQDWASHIYNSTGKEMMDCFIGLYMCFPLKCVCVCVCWRHLFTSKTFKTFLQAIWIMLINSIQQLSLPYFTNTSPGIIIHNSNLLSLNNRTIKT